MAQQIKGTDIIEDNHLSNAIKQTESLLELYKKLDEAILKTAKDTKKAASSADTNQASGIQILNTDDTKSNELKQASTQKDKQQEKKDGHHIT